MKPGELKQIVKTCVKNLSLLFTESGLYPPHHPNVIAQLKQAYTALETVTQQIDPFSLDILEGSFVFEGIPLYELKHVSEKTVQLLESKSIGRITFQGFSDPEELNAFVQFIVTKTPGESSPDLQAVLKAKGVTQIRIEQTDLWAAEQERQKLLQPKKIYAGCIEANKLIYNSVRGEQKIPMDIVAKIAKHLISIVKSDFFTCIALTGLRNYDEYRFTHSANVAILSIALAVNVLDNDSLLERFARAALLHDIGLALIPDTVLNKQGQLTDEEWQTIKQHPLLGVELLERQEQVDMLAVVIAAEHQMKHDLSGYPKIGGIVQLHPLSEIVNIASAYDAITSARTYKQPLLADKALGLMLQMVGCDFDPQYFKIFVQMMGIYPPGGFVRLNTGEVALTKRVYPNALLQPEIKILLDAAGRAIDEPRFANLYEQQGDASPLVIREMVDPASLGIDPLEFI
ncbi:MAG: HD domain-containing phosphohydrolase [Candidatus Omnitrophota bacterium]